jgi:nitrogen fixation NifU-like protein
MVTGRLDPAEAETLGKLAVFSGVSAYPTRVKCASLPWHALKTALLPDTPMT